MATAYAERERDRRNLEDDIEIRSGGTHPADSVHDIVLEAMSEEGIDLTDRDPQEISETELESCAYVATMGCSTLEIDAETDVRDWDLTDPHGRELEEVHEIREEILERVEGLFDELEEAELR